MLAAMTSGRGGGIVDAMLDLDLDTDLEPELDHKRLEAVRVHEWRAQQLRRLGLPYRLADAFAAHVDWHEVDALVARGCPLSLALDIAR